MATHLHTVCNRDCPDACGIVATVEGGRVTKIAGDKSHPVTRGFLCYRTNQYLETQYSPDRLTTPLLRRSGRLEPASWDQALDFVARELLRIRAESGPASIFHYSSGGSLGLLKKVVDYFWERFGPVTVKRGDICSGAGESAQELDFGASDSNDLFDLLSARQIILWGKNVFTSSPHTLTVLRDAKARGAEIVLVDPVHHRTASIADRFCQPRPGGDFAFAMAVARILFERGWIDPAAASYCDGLDGFRALARSRSVGDWCEEADVDEACAADLAQRLGRGGPTTILVGWGMGRRRNGGAIVRALDALGAITGNIGVPGAGVSFYFRRRKAFDASFVTGVSPRTVCEPLFGQEVLSLDAPAIRAVWITAGNPVAMLPDSETTARALSSRELVVVVDAFLTDTAQLAHVVLPTTTMLEADDLLGAYGHHWLGVARPVVSPPPEVKSDLDIVQALARRVGLERELAGSARDWKQRMMRGKLESAGITLEDLERAPMRNPLAPRIVFEGKKFATPSGRANLVTEAGPPAPRTSPDYPLLLTSVSTPKSQSSQWARPPALPLECVVHPDASSGIADGAVATLESALGSMPVRVRHDPSQRRDVALVPKGGHRAAVANANGLIHATLTDLGEGGALYDEPVRLVGVCQGVKV